MKAGKENGPKIHGKRKPVVELKPVLNQSLRGVWRRSNLTGRGIASCFGYVSQYNDGKLNVQHCQRTSKKKARNNLMSYKKHWPQPAKKSAAIRVIGCARLSLINLAT